MSVLVSGTETVNRDTAQVTDDEQNRLIYTPGSMEARFHAVAQHADALARLIVSETGDPDSVREHIKRHHEMREAALDDHMPHVTPGDYIVNGLVAVVPAEPREPSDLKIVEFWKVKELYVSVSEPFDAGNREQPDLVQTVAEYADLTRTIATGGLHTLNGSDPGAVTRATRQEFLGSRITPAVGADMHAVVRHGMMVEQSGFFDPTNVNSTPMSKDAIIPLAHAAMTPHELGVNYSLIDEINDLSEYAQWERIATTGEY